MNLNLRKTDKYEQLSDDCRSDLEKLESDKRFIIEKITEASESIRSFKRPPLSTNHIYTRSENELGERWLIPLGYYEDLKIKLYGLLGIIEYQIQTEKQKKVDE